MKLRTLLFAAAAVFVPSLAQAQCSGLFLPGYICGNNAATSGPAKDVSLFTVAPTYVTAYGAKCDDATDDSTIIQARLDAGFAYIPPGRVCRAHVTVPATSTLMGDGPHTSHIRGINTNQAVVTIATNFNGVVAGLDIIRVGTPVAGGDGIKAAGIMLEGDIYNVNIQGHWVCLALGPASFTRLVNLTPNRCWSHAVAMTPTATLSNFQYQMDTVYASLADGDCFNITRTSGTAGASSLGNFHKLSAFGCSGYSFNIEAAATFGVWGLRGSDWFLGNSGLGEVRLNTFGGDHKLGGATFLEQAGTTTTGHDGAITGISGLGSGVLITANNLGVELNGVTSNQMSVNGLIAASDVSINGGLYSNSATGWGVDITGAGRIIVNGAKVRGNVGGGLRVGAFAVNGQVTGNDIVSNTGTNCVNSSSGVVTFRNNSASCPDNDMTIVSIDGSNTQGPFLALDRASASPAANDNIGRYSFDGRNSIGTRVTYAALTGLIVVETSGAEQGMIQLQTVEAGTFQNRGLLWKGLQLGPGPTGGDKGDGTINVSSGYFVNNVAVLVNGGAAGTPSSITLTNATGFPFATGGTGVLPVVNGGSGSSTNSWTTWTPAITCAVGAVTATNTGRYRQIGRTVDVEYRLQITAINTCLATSATTNLPPVSGTATAAGDFVITGYDRGLTAKGIFGSLNSGGTTVQLTFGDGTGNNVWGGGAGTISTNAVIVLTGRFELAP